MSLNTNKGKVFTLLAACLPENEALKKSLLLDEIEEMPEYSTVKTLPCWGYLSQYYSRDALLKYDAATLKSIKTVLTRIPNVFSNMEAAISSGNAWKLTSQDKPDWTSPKSLAILDSKLKSTPESPNITNLSPASVFEIFSDDVIKNPASVLGTWKVDNCENIQASINSMLSGKLYCLPQKPFDEQSALITKADSIVAEVSKQKHRIKRARGAKKGSTAIAGLLAAFFAPLLTGMAVEGTIAFYLIAIVLSVVYLVKG